jgi:predicted pyridoxine 5'-phosphate oxidase superfamily flavin-nucleotide-binding protein
VANTLLTIDMITRKALEILENNLVITRNVNRQYDDSFAVEGAKIGSTLRIRLPDRALVTDGAALQVQDDNEQFTTLTVASQKHIGVNFTSAELTMQLDDFAERVLKPRIYPRHHSWHVAGSSSGPAEVERGRCNHDAPLRNG